MQWKEKRPVITMKQYYLTVEQIKTLGTMYSEITYKTIYTIKMVIEEEQILLDKTEAEVDLNMDFKMDFLKNPSLQEWYRKRHCGFENGFKDAKLQEWYEKRCHNGFTFETSWCLNI